MLRNNIDVGYLDTLPFDEWYDMYNEIIEQSLKENWRREAPKMSFEDYKSRLSEIAKTGLEKEEFDRLQRLANL